VGVRGRKKTLHPKFSKNLLINPMDPSSKNLANTLKNPSPGFSTCVLVT
jgi:hypothetical protein